MTGLRWTRVDLPDGRILAIGWSGDEPVECIAIGKHAECISCGRPLIVRRAREWDQGHYCEDCVTVMILEATDRGRSV